MEADYFKERKDEISRYLTSIIPIRERWIKKNSYYYNILLDYLRFNIQENKSVLQVKSDTGFFLNGVRPSCALGIEENSDFVAQLKQSYPHIDFKYGIAEDIHLDKEFDYVISVNSIGQVVDVKRFFERMQDVMHDGSRLIIIYYNKLWEYLLKLAELFGLKIKTPQLNWLSDSDIANLLYLSGFEIIKKSSFILLPVYIPLASRLINTISKLPFINKFCFIQSLIARRLPKSEDKDYTCSIVVPCKNEEGNISEIIKRVPKFGRHIELILVDDKSSDNTLAKIQEEIMRNPHFDIKLVAGPGICKSEAVWKGFEAASGEILLILDADLSVPPEELIHFYTTLISGRGEFINGSRLTYPMHGKAMKSVNLVGNKFFSFLFSYILGQNLKDTLCGTKVLFKKDFLRMKQYIGTWGIKDRWGDYELLFGASRLNLKIVDLPVHYCQRRSGTSKMTARFREGVVMFRMCLAAYDKLKF